MSFRGPAGIVLGHGTRDATDTRSDAELLFGAAKELAGHATGPES
jgi:hypothetical protein